MLRRFAFFGVPVIFSAKVAPAAPANGEPGGTVRFSLDGSAVCDVPVDPAGEAKCQAPTLYAGDHDVVASYSGEADFAASEGALTESVVKVPSHTVASTSASTAEPGQPVTLTANVVGGLPGETPAGTVSFSAGSQLLGKAPVQPTVAGAGRARIETSALAAGSHQIVASYSGDDAIEPSASPPITQIVNGTALGLPPPACALRNVRARVLVFRGRNEVRLVARYRAAAPATVTIRFGDERGRGAARVLGKLTHQFAGEDRVRVVRHLPAAEMKRLRHAHRGFAASIAVAGSPGYCAEESSQPLSVRRLVSGQRVWFQSNSDPAELPANSR